MQTPQIVFTLDTETTGLDTNVAEPVQIACTAFMFVDSERISQSKIVFNSLCNPSVEIEEGAEDIHGISKDDVSMSPEPAVVAETVDLLIGQAETIGEVVIATYNGSAFDLPLVQRFCPKIVTYPHVDVFSLVMREMPDKFGKLTEVYERYLGKRGLNAHDAAADCLMTSAILRKYCEEKKVDPISVSEDLREPKAYKIFPFGKHAGKPIKQVPRSYVRWCLKNFDKISPDLKMTFETVLGKV